jgi:purine-nucleoside phosphorylase
MANLAGREGRMPLHIRAEPGDVAPVVLLPGDPGRARRLAAMLDGVRCYNEHRGLLGFTGTAAGRPISVQTTGMGAPSAAIVVEELIMLGARVLVRAGTAGATGAVRTGELVIATASVPLDGTTRTYLHGDPYAPVADHGVVAVLLESCRALGLAHHAGLIATGDALYAEDVAGSARWAARGVLAFEMEASAIFTVAALRGVRAGCIVVAVNSVAGHDWLQDEAFARAEGLLLQAALGAAMRLSEP